METIWRQKFPNPIVKKYVYTLCSPRITGLHDNWGWKGCQEAVVQSPVRSRVSHKIRPCYLGLYPAGSWKHTKIETSLGNLFCCWTVPTVKNACICTLVHASERHCSPGKYTGQKRNVQGFIVILQNFVPGLLNYFFNHSICLQVYVFREGWIECRGLLIK